MTEGEREMEGGTGGGEEQEQKEGGREGIVRSEPRGSGKQCTQTTHIFYYCTGEPVLVQLLYLL